VYPVCRGLSGWRGFAKVAEAIPDRLKRLIFWNAFVLNDGECLNDNAPPHYRALFDSLASASPDFTVMLP